MTLTLSDIDSLQSPQGQNLLLQLMEDDLSPGALLALISRLRQSYPQELISAAISMAQLRQKAVTKFGEDAGKLFFTDSALQQASDPAIRQYRAEQSKGLHVLDVCCGIGTDSIAFARAGAIVHGIDLDETRIAIAQYNAEQLDLTIQFTVGDVREGINPADYDLIFYDPARRDENGKRIFDVERYQPPLSLIREWQGTRLMAKISPGVDLTQLEDYQSTIEFISVEGDLKEAVLHHPVTVPFIATRLEEGRVSQIQENGVSVDVAISVPQGWLCEPDPAILRTNLVQNIAESLNGTMLDSTIAYFCADQKPQSEWVRAWKIRDWMPFNLKKLRARLRDMDAGILTVKKRGSPISPDDLIRKLKLKGKQSCTVVLTRYNEQAIAIICDDIEPV